jgi:hypothetical protein
MKAKNIGTILIVIGLVGTLLGIGFVAFPLVRQQPLPSANGPRDPDGVWKPIAAVQKAAMSAGSGLLLGVIGEYIRTSSSRKSRKR